MKELECEDKSNLVISLIGSTISKSLEIWSTIFFLSLEVASYWYNRFKRAIREPTELNLLKVKLKEAKTYQEYYEAGTKLDSLTGGEVWKSNPISRHYDHQLIYRRLKHLNQIAETGDIVDMMDFLRSGLLRNLGGMNDPKLYSYCYIGTKTLIEQYTAAVNGQFERIAEALPSQLSNQAKLDFFHDVKLAFGTTALLLHGGATFGLSHIGVVKSLFEQDLLPRIICGTEIGALIATLVGIHTDAELPNFLTAEGIDLQAFSQVLPGRTFKRKLARLFKTGHLLNIKILEQCVMHNTGDITFEEAYQRTNRVLNITVSPTRKNEVPQLLNYLTAPNVLIRSAACASASTVGIYEKVDLLIKDEFGNIVPWSPSAVNWGSNPATEPDSPLSRLSELFNVNHFIVSQASPYIVPFLSRSLQLQEDSWSSRIRSVFLYEVRYRVQQLGQLGLLPRRLTALADPKFAGHVTIFPKLRIRDFNSLFSNPTTSLADYWSNKGIQSTFHVLELIRNRCSLEFALDRVYMELRTATFTKTIPHVESILYKRAEVKRTKSIH